MQILETAIPDVKIIVPKVFGDERGFFLESYNQKTFQEALGINANFVQDNHSRSTKNILRGLHYQCEHTQGKLVRVISGEIYDVAVDLRQNSPTFKKWIACRISDKNHHMLWVPPQFAHGFVVLSESADVLYKTTDFYHPPSEKCLRWDDPELAIPWPLQNAPILSVKDSQGAFLKDAQVF